MENTTNSVIYTVNSDLDDGILYAEFETKEAAMEYAKRNMDKLPFVDELEVSRDADGEIADVFSTKTIWAHNELEYPTNEFVDDDEDIDPWAELDSIYKNEHTNKHVLGDTTWFESMDNLVETLEENEDEVECKECFELFPKADAIKLAVGYVCPTCAECGTVSEEDLFKMDFPEYEKMSVGNDMIPDESTDIPAEEEIENDPISTPEEAVPFLVNDEEEAVAGYEKAAEVVADSDLENKEEILDTIEHIKEEEEEHIEELTDLVDTNTDDDPAAEDDEIIEVENDPVSEDEESEEILTEDSGLKTWTCWYEGSDIGTVEAATEEEATEEMMSKYPEYQYNNTDWGATPVDSLDEHVNEEHPAIESDQELEGTDNAVEKCKTTPVVTHSKDELPLDSCDHEKLTEATGDELNQIFKICKKIGIKTGADLNRFVKDEVAEGQNLLNALKAYQAELGDDFQAESLTEADNLTEAWVVNHITNDIADQAKQEIIDKLSDTYPYTNGRFNITWDNSFHNRETIVDFNIVDNQVNVEIERIHTDAFSRQVTTNTRQMEGSFAKANARTGRPRALAFLRDLETAVTEVNRAHNIGVRARRNIRIQQELTPELAEEFRTHITDITYKIPMQVEYTAADIPGEYTNRKGEVIIATPEDLDKAAENLSAIRDEFLALPFAADANVIDRALYTNAGEPADSAVNIGKSWRAEAKISFDCQLGDLTQAAQQLIFSAQVNSSRTELKADAKQIDCYRLANALAIYFGNDAKFYETTGNGIELNDIR